MKESLQAKLQHILERFEELSHLLSTPEIIENHDKFKNLSKEYATLEPTAECFKKYLKAQDNLIELDELSKSSEADIAEMALQEIELAREEIMSLEEDLHLYLIPKDSADERNVFLEIRAGTGGDEAAIFAGDLFRMYSRYAEETGWQVDIISAHHAGLGGFKEIIAEISGHNVYANLKFESGTHRVQRVPATESQGRVHTSACTVAIMPAVEEIDEVEINADDLRIDTYRSSGAGGQHVNKTDSAIRITHLPTGVVVECQDERSQHKNRAKAMALLKTRLLDLRVNKQKEEQAQTRKLMVGSGDRSERIRTYNYPQGRITDHRINLTLYQLPDIMEGKLEVVIDALKKEHNAEMLAQITNQA